MKRVAQWLAVGLCITASCNGMEKKLEKPVRTHSKSKHHMCCTQRAKNAVVGTVITATAVVAAAVGIGVGTGVVQVPGVQN